MIFITGINGLIGSFTARKFLEEGHKIKALKRKDSDLRFLKGMENEIEWVEGDITDVQLLEQATQNADSIIHCAGIISFYSKERDKMFKINVEGTSNIVNAALKNNIQKFCYISSVTALGRKKTDSIIDETHKWEESELNSMYGKSKYLAEMEVERGIAEGLKAVILNPSVVLGPTNWNRSSARLFKYVWDKKPYYTSGLVNYVDVRDVAEIIHRIMLQDMPQDHRFILNAGAVSYKELLGLVAEKFEIRKPSVEVGYLFLNLAWRIAYLLSYFTNKEPIITKETAQGAKYSFQFSNQKIKNKLNFEFKDINESIQWTCFELSKLYDLKQDKK